MTWLKIKPIIFHIICLTRPEYLPGIEIKVKLWDVDLWCQQVHDHKMWIMIKRWGGGDSVRKPASGSFQESVHLWKLLPTTLIFLLSGQLNACEVYCNSVGPKNDDEKMQLLSINHPLRAQSSYLLRLGGVFFSLAIHVSDQKLNQLLYLRGDIILLFLWQTRSFNILSAGINGFMETTKKSPCGWIRNR